MFLCASEVSPCVFVFCFLWPLIAWSQTGPNSAGKPTLSPQSSTSSTNVAEFSRDQSQDTQFVALLRARDGQFSNVTDLRRIIGFHDNFRSRMERDLSDGNFPMPTGGKITETLNKTLSQLEQLEKNIKIEPDIARQRHLASVFDDQYPLFVADPDGSGRRKRNSAQPGLILIQQERLRATEAFQNSSIENREWLTKYMAVFSYLDTELPKLDSGVHLKNLDSLPSSFAVLAGAQPDPPGSEPSKELFLTLSLDQIMSAISKYRTALNQSFGDIGGQVWPQVSAIRDKALADIDSIGKDLNARTSETNENLRDLEKSIAGAARSLYGNKVGSDSFNYLLIVFAAVFGLIMGVPRIYPEVVAGNILKAEFLLQFSTVFVLVAAIIILGIGELIDKQQLPVLLAGISGYVLGQLGKV
jgi:hypothetical protein